MLPIRYSAIAKNVLNFNLQLIFNFRVDPKTVAIFCCTALQAMQRQKPEKLIPPPKKSISILTLGVIANLH